MEPLKVRSTISGPRTLKRSTPRCHLCACTSALSGVPSGFRHGKARRHRATRRLRPTSRWSQPPPASAHLTILGNLYFAAVSPRPSVARCRQTRLYVPRAGYGSRRSATIGSAICTSLGPAMPQSRRWPSPTPAPCWRSRRGYRCAGGPFSGASAAPQRCIDRRCRPAKRRQDHPLLGGRARGLCLAMSPSCSRSGPLRSLGRASHAVEPVCLVEPRLRLAVVRRRIG